MTSTAVAAYTPAEAPPAALPRGGAVDALPVFASDGDAADGLGRAGPAALLAELLVHRRAETPLAVAVTGPAGSGKSRFLDAVAGAAGRLAEAARGSGDPGPFLRDVAVARVRAAPGRGPVPALVGAVVDALAARHAAFAEEAVHAGGDPREAARLAGDRVAALRRSLDGERQALDELSGRRARLTDAVLFEATGSRVDGFARANRGRIEARLRGFGLASPDPLRTYKELVRDADAGGGARLGLVLRALWGYRGQGTLLALAVVLAAASAAAARGAEDPGAVSDGLAGFGDRFTALTDWARAHLDLLGPVSQIAGALAVLALLALAVRAARFLGPVLRGASLLRADFAARRRDLDGLLAHQTRRVDALAAEAEAAGRGAEAAQRRAEGPRDAGALSDHGAALAREMFGLGRTPEAAAEALFARIGAEVARGGEGRPERVVAVVDGLDALPPAELEAFLGAAHRLLARPGFAVLAALERDAAAAALGEADPAGAAARLDRLFGLTYDLGAEPGDAAALAGRLVDPRVADAAAAPAPDPSRSALDRGFEPFEEELVRRLAPFAGPTPRAVKRFVNGYRVARADPRLARAAPAAFAMLALSLALDGTGAGGALARFDDEVAAGKVALDGQSDFGRAFAAAVAAAGTEMAAADIRRGLAVGRSYGRRG